MYIYLLRLDTSYSAMTAWYVRKKDDLLQLAIDTHKDLFFLDNKDKIIAEWVDVAKTLIEVKVWVEPDEKTDWTEPDSCVRYVVVPVCEYKPLKKKEN